MIGAIIGLILTLIFIGVLWWGVQRLMALVPIAEPFRTIIYVLSVILMVAVVIWAITVVLGIGGIHVPRFALNAMLA